jgi:hypothetical protein
LSFSIQLINNYLSSPQCKKILVKDGISSPYLEIKKNPGFFSEIFLEVDSFKDKCPEIRTSFSILKNLDHYQYLICNLIPNTVDTDPYKKDLQKLRLLIIFLFAKFLELLNNKNYEQIEQWNLLSKKLLEIVSETVNYFRQGINFEEILNEIKLEDEFYHYLNLNKKIIDDILDHYYL